MDAPRLVVLLAGSALLLATGGCRSSTSAAAPTSSPRPAYHGVEPTSSTSRARFALTDTTGAPYDFYARTQGRPTFVYFGYTHCPDECPTAMADLAAALRKRPTPDARVVFVTTDPARDTGPVLRRWLDQFSTSFVGLRGTQAQVDAATEAAGLTSGKQQGPQPTLAGHPDQHPKEAGTAPHQHEGPLGYAVTHSAVILAYDAADRLPVAYPGGVTPSDIAADLPLLS